MTLHLQPIKFSEAKQFILDFHSHHIPPQGWKFGIAVNDGTKVVGVITVGRPISRYFDDGYTAEITRCCTDRTEHVASMLYGAARRACKALGYKRVITYTLETEEGISLKAAGFVYVHTTVSGTWSSEKRPRIDKHPTCKKLLWEVRFGNE